MSAGKPDPNLNSIFTDWLGDVDFSKVDLKKDMRPPFTRYNKDSQSKVVKTRLWRDTHSKFDEEA